MIKIYCIPLCPYSDMLKNLLKYHNIEFENIDISRNEKAKQEMIKKSSQSEITPVIDFNGQIFIGFDREKIKEVLKIQNGI